MKQDLFTGLRLGSLIDILPPLPYLKGQPKLSSRAIPGLFLGYHLHPGAIFKGEYYVVSLDKYKRVVVSREHLAPIDHRGKEVTVPAGGCRFPDRQDRDRLVREIPPRIPRRDVETPPRPKPSNPKT